MILLVFDITNPVSFDSLEEWLHTIRRVVVSQERQPVLVVIANKCKSQYWCGCQCHCLKVVKYLYFFCFEQEENISSFVMY